MRHIKTHRDFSEDQKELTDELRSFTYDLSDDGYKVSIIDLTEDKYHSPKFAIKITSEINLASEGWDEHTKSNVGFDSVIAASERNKKMWDLSLDLLKRLDLSKSWKVKTFIPGYGGPSGKVYSVIHIYCNRV